MLQRFAKINKRWENGLEWRSMVMDTQRGVLRCIGCIQTSLSEVLCYHCVSGVNWVQWSWEASVGILRRVDWIVWEDVFSMLVTLDNRTADGFFLAHYVDNNFEMQRQAARRKTKWKRATWEKGYACLSSTFCHILNSNHNTSRNIRKHIWGSQCIANKVTFVFLAVTWSKAIKCVTATYSLSQSLLLAD